MNTAPGSRHKIAVFASGAGSNARNLIAYAKSSNYEVAVVACNKPGAGVLQVAAEAHVPTLLIEKERFFRGDAYLPGLKDIELVVLAGFLWKVPQALINAFPRRIINIHPALLPAFGGKGMYGKFVHEAVLASGAMASGITIHYVDEHYDQGDIIFQAQCPVAPTDSPETLQQKVHALEHEWYPKIVEQVVGNIEQTNKEQGMKK